MGTQAVCQAIIVVTTAEHEHLTKWAKSCNGYEEGNMLCPEYGKVVANYNFNNYYDRSTFFKGLEANFGRNVKIVF